ncbi:MAG TPA: hypothetical protein VJM32_03875, partial [Candidatus Saccharimonadales bacterium]|nr:hypothetical protein [Candidatus Saccharimonadales bacterium]
SASVGVLQAECERLNLRAKQSSSKPELRRMLGQYATAFKAYLRWVAWAERLQLDLEITEDTQINTVLGAVCDSLFDRLQAGGYVKGARRGKVLSHYYGEGEGFEDFYITGRENREFVTITGYSPDGKHRSSVMYAAACAFADVQEIYIEISNLPEEL